MSNTKDKDDDDVSMADADAIEEVQEPANAEFSSDLHLDTAEDARLVNIFWTGVWPKLQTNGWIKSRHNDEAVLAPTNGKIADAAEDGTDYFTRIKDVIERLNQRSTRAEKSAADVYRRAASKPNKLNPTFGTTKSKRKGQLLNSKKKKGRSSITSKSADVADDDSNRKDSGNIFPRKTSSVGDNYQATVLPDAGSFKESTNTPSTTYCELLWDPNEAVKQGIVLVAEKDLVSGVKANLRESALLALAEVKYNADSFRTDKLPNLKVTDGSDWDATRRSKFAELVYLYRRDIPKIATLLNVPIKTCHAYYLSQFKSTSEYRILKTVCVEERERNLTDSSPSSAPTDKDSCVICGDGGELLICDGCDGEYHMGCLKPKLAAVPDGHWECDSCVDAKLLTYHKEIVERLCITTNDPATETKTNDDGSTTNKPVFDRAVLDAVKAFSCEIREALATPTLIASSTPAS